VGSTAREHVASTQMFPVRFTLPRRSSATPARSIQVICLLCFLSAQLDAACGFRIRMSWRGLQAFRRSLLIPHRFAACFSLTCLLHQTPGVYARCAQGACFIICDTSSLRVYICFAFDSRSPCTFRAVFVRMYDMHGGEEDIFVRYGQSP